MPVRIQRKRTRGWVMPEGVIYCGRPTRWGNSFIPGEVWGGFIDDCGAAHRLDGPLTPAAAVWLYKVQRFPWAVDFDATLMAQDMRMRLGVPVTAKDWHFEPRALGELRGHDLACWCGLDRACHVDVLLELANA